MVEVVCACDVAAKTSSVPRKQKRAREPRPTRDRLWKELAKKEPAKRRMCNLQGWNTPTRLNATHHLYEIACFNKTVQHTVHNPIRPNWAHFKVIWVLCQVKFSKGLL